MTLPVALLHGFAGDPGSWDAVRRALGSSVTTLAPALVGHGDPSDGRVADFEGEVDRIASVLLAGASRWHLAGYSLGGRVALGLLVRHPGLFASATLVGARPGLESEEERRDRARDDERWCRTLESEGIEAFVRRWEELPLFATQAGLGAGLLEEQRRARLRRDPAGLVRSLRLTGLAAMPAFWGDLERLEVPATLMVGELDERFRALALRMRERWPSACVELAPGAGHNVVLERPERVAEAIARALEVAA